MLGKSARPIVSATIVDGGRVKKPNSSDAITAEWLNDVLHRSGILTDANIVAVSAADLGTGVGILGEVARLTVQYDKATSGPSSFISKCPTANATNLQVARSQYFYPREVSFYTRLAQHSPIRTPRLYHAELDMTDHTFVLLLEDLADLQRGDQVTGLTPEQANTAIDAIARLHGAWWGKVDSGAMDALFDIANPDNCAALQAGYQYSVAPALANFADCYSAYTKTVAERLAPVAARVVRQLSSGERSLVHGDYRADNLLFTPAGDDVAAVDWQISGRGGPLCDVAYLICNSVTRKYREEAESTLLRRYHDALLRMGVSGFSFNDCWQSYRFAVLYGLFVAIFSTGGMDLGNERGVAAVRALVRRVDAAIDSLQVGDLLPA